MDSKHVPDLMELTLLATRAGVHTTYDTLHNAQLKKDGTIVTNTDHGINNMIIKYFADRYPHIAVLAEEGSREIPEAEYTLICDPLDGTLPYAHNVPVYSICIALLHNGYPIASVIYVPASRDLYAASRGMGAFKNNHLIKVSEQSTLVRANIGMAIWSNAPRVATLNQIFAKLITQFAHVTNLLAMAYLGTLVANGMYHGTILSMPVPWETASLHVLIEEAGGVVTDMEGNPLVYDQDNSYHTNGHIMSNGHLHEALLTTIKSCT